MKFLILTALVAVTVAEPEAKADPAYLHYAGYASPYTTAYGYKAAPYAYGASPYAYAQPAAYYTGTHFLGKRDADAEPEADAEADPAYLHYGGYASPYATTYGYRAATPYAYGVAPYTYAKPAYYTGTHFLGKREAEAEPQYGYRFPGSRFGVRPRYSYGNYFGRKASFSPRRYSYYF